MKWANTSKHGNAQIPTKQNNRQQKQLCRERSMESWRRRQPC